MDSTIRVAKTKALISFAVTASLFSHMQKAGFLTTRLIGYLAMQEAQSDGSDVINV